jgi:hypothetical protein
MVTSNLPHPTHADWLAPVVLFLNQIGVPTSPGLVDIDSFLPGVAIRGSGLVFDALKLQACSDLLHEAGHIAVTPFALRQTLCGVVLPEQQIAYAGEVEAIAWSFAAATHIGMPLDVLFHKDGYRGNAGALAFNFSLGVYPGVHGLKCAGFFDSDDGQSTPYPRMARWLRL